jgi:hypothetical protein
MRSSKSNLAITGREVFLVECSIHDTDNITIATESEDSHGQSFVSEDFSTVENQENNCSDREFSTPS